MRRPVVHHGHMIRNLYVTTLAVLLILLAFAYGQEQAHAADDLTDHKVSAHELRILDSSLTRGQMFYGIGPVHRERQCNNTPTSAATRCVFRLKMYNPQSFGQVSFHRDGDGPLRIWQVSIWHCPQRCF